MPRRERPLEPGEGALLRFAADLRGLRRDAGNPTYRELAQRAFYSAGTLSDAAAGRKLPSLAVTLGYVRACGGDAEAWERRWYSVAAADEAPPVSEDCPYVGLMPYQGADADKFFGRDRLVNDVYDQITTHRFVTVFGASGAGKSSLLRAGVLPKVEQRTILFTPGAHPFEECAVHLATTAGTTAGQLLPDLLADPRNLHKTIRRALDDADEIVLVVDQFEEVFTRCADSERVLFLDALLHAAGAEDSRTRVIVAVRADFYPRCADHAGLAAAVSRAQVLVGPMTAMELRDAISRPAVEAGCTVEGALVAELVAEAHRQPGVLPLLSHVLRESWARRRGNTVTLAGYQATGGIREALARTAESLFTALDSGQRASARSLFVRLTALGADGLDTRRRVGWADMDVDDKVLRTFTEARLITVDDGGVEMTHEALIHGWPRLSGWLTDDRDRLRTQRQLAEDASTWTSLDRDPDSLYRGGRLTVAQELPLDELTARERAFVDASTKAEQTRQHAARRRLHQLRWLSVGLAVALVTTGVFAGLMTHSQRQTEEQRRVAVSRQLAAQADAVARTSPGDAIRLSLEAIDTAPTVEARSSVLSLLRNPVSHGAIPDSGDIAMSGDGRVLAVNGTHGINIWDIPRREWIRTFDESSLGSTVEAHALSPNGERLAVSGADRQLRVWDLTYVSTPESRTLEADVGALAFSPDGDRLAVLDTRHALSIFDTDALRDIASFPGATAPPAEKPSVTYSPDGTTVAASAGATTIAVHDAVTARIVSTLSTVQGGSPFAFSPNGRTIAAADQEGNLVAHDLTTRAATTLVRQPGQLSGLAYLPDGNVVFASVDHGIRSWRQGRAEPLLLSTVTPAQLLATRSTILASDSRNVLIWSVDRFPHYASGSPVALAFDATGRNVLASNHNGPQLERLRRTDPHTLIAPRDVESTFSPDYRFLAIPDQPREVDIYDVATGDHKVTFTNSQGTISDMAFAENGRDLAVSYLDSDDEAHVVMWDIDEQRVLTHVPIDAARLALDSDARNLAAVITGYDSVVAIWRMGFWKKTKVAELRSNAGRVTALSYRPDGRVLAVGYEDGTIELWDTTRHQRLAYLRGHDTAVADVRFSPDGTMAASVDRESTILLWNITDRGQLARIDDLPANVTSIAWHPNNDAIATALSTGAVLIWPTDTDEAVNLLCQTLKTDFTNATQPPPNC